MILLTYVDCSFMLTCRINLHLMFYFFDSFAEESDSWRGSKCFKPVSSALKVTQFSFRRTQEQLSGWSLTVQLHLRFWCSFLGSDYTCGFYISLGPDNTSFFVRVIRGRADHTCIFYVSSLGSDYTCVFTRCDEVASSLRMPSIHHN
jgi:hypothetical protein